MPMQEKRPAASSRAQWQPPQMLCVGPTGLAWPGKEAESPSCLHECRADSATKVSSHLGPGRDPFSHGPGVQRSQKGLGGLSAQVFHPEPPAGHPGCRCPGPAPTARPPLLRLHCPSLSASQLLGIRAVFLAHRLLPARPFPGVDGFCFLPHTIFYRSTQVRNPGGVAVTPSPFLNVGPGVRWHLWRPPSCRPVWVPLLERQPWRPVCVLLSLEGSRVLSLGLIFPLNDSFLGACLIHITSFC